MTKTLALAALVAGSLLAGTTLQAQDAPANTPPGKHGIHNRPNRGQIAKELNLTDAQKAKVKTVMEGQRAKMKALREDTSLTPKDRRAKARKIRETTHDKFMKILTPEQREKWHKLMEQERHPGKKHEKKGSQTDD